MSKVDAMRAIRDARFAEAAKGSPTPAARRATPTQAQAAAPARSSTAPAARTATAEPAGAEGLCGHRNMGGKTCTREADHVTTGTKSHRYA